jgi:hypothetical protein
MAILRGEEARQWLAQNPNKAYKNLTTNVSVPRQQSGLEKFFMNISKPIRTFVPAAQELGYTISDLVRMWRGEGLTDRPDKYFGMTEEESTAFREDPLKQGLKAGSALISYGMPTGPAASAVTPGARIASAAGRAAIPGAMSGFGYSDEGEELSGTLTGGALGGLIGGATQGIGEASRAIKARPQGTGKIVNTLEVDEIAALPKRVKNGLRDQTKSAGFWDEGLGETKSIQNFLKNRGLAGKTPQETLEQMTQEFYRAQGLKKQGIKEIGGLSRGYIDQIKGNIDEAIQYSGLSAKEKTALKEMFRVLDSAPTDAKTLDKIAQDWYKMGLTRAGEQKMTQSGLFMDGAKAIRDALKEANKGGSYTEGMSILSQILGLEDKGQISKAAIESARQGIDIPLFAGSGFRSADVKVPQVSNVINKTRANMGLAKETGAGMGSGLLQGVARVAEPVAGAAQGAIPGIVGATQAMPQRQQEPQLEGLGSMLPPQQQAPQIDQMALIEAVMNGQISTSEADWLMEMLGGGTQQQTMPKTDSGRKAMVARDAALQALNILEQDPSAAGKLQGIENIFYDITGQANTATEYKTQIEGLRSQVFNALGGTALSPTEKAQYEKFLPKQNDSPAQAKQKLEILIPMMEALMGTEVDMPSEDNSSALYQMLGLQ